MKAEWSPPGPQGSAPDQTEERGGQSDQTHIKSHGKSFLVSTCSLTSRHPLFFPPPSLPQAIGGRVPIVCYNTTVSASFFILKLPEPGGGVEYRDSNGYHGIVYFSEQSTVCTRHYLQRGDRASLPTPMCSPVLLLLAAPGLARGHLQRLTQLKEQAPALSGQVVGECS